MGKPTPMDRESADRIGRAAWNDPISPTTQSGWDKRAQSAAERNEGDEEDEEDE